MSKQQKIDIKGLISNTKESFMITPVISEILVVEEQLRMAMLKSNIGELDKLLSEKLIFTDHMGQLISKHDDIAGHQQGDLMIENINLSDQKITVIDDMVVVSVDAEILGCYRGSPANGMFHFTRIWENKKGIWQVVVGHSRLHI